MRNRARTHIYLGSQDCFTLKSILVHTSLECVHLFHLLAESKKTVFDSLHAAMSVAGGEYFRYSNAVRRPTIARLFAAPLQAIRSVRALPSAQALQALSVQRESRRREFINPYCAQNVKRSPSLNKCARCPAHIPSGGFPPPPPERMRLITRSLSFFWACIKL